MPSIPTAMSKVSQPPSWLADDDLIPDSEGTQRIDGVKDNQSFCGSKKQLLRVFFHLLTIGLRCSATLDATWPHLHLVSLWQRPPF
jgi:hypothetical protein